MSEAEKLKDLIARVEGAEVKSRLLDAEIHDAVGLPERYTRREMTVDGVPVGFGVIPLRYTASLDAALTLVPEGWSPSIGQSVHHQHWQARMAKVAWDGIEDVGSDHDVSPALALCAAALRARLAILEPAP